MVIQVKFGRERPLSTEDARGVISVTLWAGGSRYIGLSRLAAPSS
jgi:hypothetical protein